MALPMRWLVRCGRPERGDWRECGPTGQCALERLHLHTLYGRPLAVNQDGERRSVFRSEPYSSLDGADCYAFTLDCMQYYEYDKRDKRVRALWKTPAAAWQRNRKREREEAWVQDVGPDDPESVEYERVLARRLRERLKNYGNNERKDGSEDDHTRASEEDRAEAPEALEVPRPEGQVWAGKPPP